MMRTPLATIIALVAASPALAAGATADARGIFGSTIVPSTLTKSAKAKPARARWVDKRAVKQGKKRACCLP